MSCVIRAMRARDVPHVLAIERHAFPADPWTSAAWNGALARATRGGRTRRAAVLAWLLRFTRAQQMMSLLRLIILLTLDHPPGLSYIVAEADSGAIAGYGCVRAVPGGDASIPLLAVRPGYQGQKTGTHLLLTLIDMAIADGCGGMFLYVRADNPGAQRLYRRTGFTEAGIRRRFYQPSGTDAVVMRLYLRLRLPAPDRAPLPVPRQRERERSDDPFRI